MSSKDIIFCTSNFDFWRQEHRCSREQVFEKLQLQEAITAMPLKHIHSWNRSLITAVTGHNNPPNITPRSESPFSIARPDTTHRITHRRRSTWKLSFRIGRRKPPDIRGYVRGLRPPILKLSFQNPLSCNRKRRRTLGFWPRGFTTFNYPLGHLQL